MRWLAGVVLAWVAAIKLSLDAAAVFAALAALGTGVYNALRVRQQKPIVEAEIEDRAVKRMREALDVYVQDNQRLRAELDIAVQRLSTCDQRIDKLEDMLRRAGIDF